MNKIIVYIFIGIVVLALIVFLLYPFISNYIEINRTIRQSGGDPNDPNDRLDAMIDLMVNRYREQTRQALE